MKTHLQVLKIVIMSLLFLASDHAVGLSSVLTGNLNIDNTFEAYISTDDSLQGSFLSSGNDISNGQCEITNLVEQLYFEMDKWEI
jgi:MSHA biogenesis protein MshQ